MSKHAKLVKREAISGAEVDAVISEVSKIEREQDYMRSGRTQKGYAPPEFKGGESRLRQMMREYARRNGGLYPYF